MPAGARLLPTGRVSATADLSWEQAGGGQGHTPSEEEEGGLPSSVGADAGGD